jgi:4'-phosphopantetheinyl transferase
MDGRQPTMAKSDVDVWVAQLDRSPFELRSLASLLSDDELERARRFAFTRDRDRFIAAHGFLRSVLGAALGSEPTAIALATEPAGKPFLEGSPALKPDLHFNLSHSAGVALCALAYGRAVGVDIEAVQPLDELDGVMWHVCTSAERAALGRLGPAERLRMFVQIWTRKEAYVKMTGRGLGFDVRRIQVQVGARGCRVSVSVDGRHPRGSWELRDIPAPIGFVAALAAQGQRWRANYHPWLPL